MADGNITKDAMYDAVAPDDFESMLELDRYNDRSTAFDKIISATHDHFWDPLDKKLHRLRRALRHGERGHDCRRSMIAALQPALRRRDT